MKTIYGDRIDDMFYGYLKYTPNATEPISRIIYQNNVEKFMRRLNELEEEFGFTIVADYAIDYDDMTESQLLLYDNKYGCVGEIYEVYEEDQPDSVDVDE